MEDKKSILGRRGMIKNAGIAVLGAGAGSLITPQNVVSQTGSPLIKIEQDGAVVRPLNSKLGDVVSILDFGNAEDGDWSDIIQKAIDTTDFIHIPSGRFRIDKQINCPFNKTLICDGIVTMDGTVAFDGSSGLNVLNVGEISQIELPGLAKNLFKGDTKLIFQQPHGRNIGDIVCLYNPLAYSWSSSREYYKAGEFCRVARIDSDTELTLDSGLFDNYQASEVDVYYKPMGYFNVIGYLEVLSASDGSRRPFCSVTLNQVRDSGFQLKAVATRKAYAACIVKHCFNVNFNSSTFLQEEPSGLGGDYGLVISNSQHIRSQGYYFATRHAVAHGGGNGICDVIVRDCHHEGTFKSLGGGGANAIDTHGNCELISFSGTCYSGASFGGKSIKYRGTIYADYLGICLYGGEVKALDFDLAGVKFISYKDPDSLASGRGVIDFGGNSIFEVDNLECGTLNLSGASIEAPKAKMGVVVRKRNKNVITADHTINLRNAEIIVREENNSMPIYITSQVDGVDFGEVLTGGLRLNKGKKLTRARGVNLKD